MKQNSQYYYH